jgi:hypothetical protein
MHQLRAANDPENGDEIPDLFCYTSPTLSIYFAELLKPS